MKGGPDLVHDCEAFVFDEPSNTWTSRGFIAGPFLPNCAPQRMPDGDFLMAGRMAEQPGQKPTIPAVAISRGENLTAPWSVVRLLPAKARADTHRMPFPETTAIVESRQITALVRGDGPTPWPSSAAIAGELGRPRASTISHGRIEDLRRPVEHRPTIRPVQSSRRPAAESAGHRRQPARPEAALSKMWKLRDGPSQELKAGPEWSYPCAIEFEGKLYVVYTSEKHHCVLTAIPVKSLAVPAAKPIVPKCHLMNQKTVILEARRDPWSGLDDGVTM